MVMPKPRAERSKFVGDRFRRIWYITEEIAANPGQTRRTLAARFHLSERQVQADLNIIRCDMRLPLVRRQGYRFIGEGPSTGPCSMRLQDAQLLVMILRAARNDRSIHRDRLDALTAKLPPMFPPHLQPIVARTIEAITAQQGSTASRVFSALADALLQGAWVELRHRDRGAFTWAVSLDPVIRPELLIPYLESWYVLGEHRKTGRTVMLKVGDLDAVTAVAP